MVLLATLKSKTAVQAFLSLQSAITAPLPPHDDHAANALLTELLIGHLAIAAPTPANAGTARWSSLLEMLQAGPERSWSLPQMAAMVSLSPFHFSRLFRQRTGLAPHAFLMPKRIHLARTLIGEGVSVAEAASRAGFSNQSHLHRIFVRTYGYRPGDFSRACLAPAEAANARTGQRLGK